MISSELYRPESMQSATRTESITKLDAAERQIRTAVRLFFAEEHSVSIITLARAGGVERREGVELHELSTVLGEGVHEGRRRHRTSGGLKAFDSIEAC